MLDVFELPNAEMLIMLSFWLKVTGRQELPVAIHGYESAKTGPSRKRNCKKSISFSFGAQKENTTL